MNAKRMEGESESERTAMGCFESVLLSSARNELMSACSLRDSVSRVNGRQRAMALNRHCRNYLLIDYTAIQALHLTVTVPND